MENRRILDQTEELDRRVQVNVGAESLARIVDSGNLSGLFGTFLNDFLSRFLQHMGQYIFFPLAALASIIVAILSARQAYLERHTDRFGSSFLRAGVETVTALGVTAVVIGSFAAAAVFATVAPIAFTAIMAFKTLYHFGVSVFSGVKALMEKDPQKKKEYKKAAFDNSVAVVAGILATAAVVGVMVVGFKAMAVAGIVAGVIGVGYAFHTIYKFAAKAKKDGKKVEEAPKNQEQAADQNQLNLQRQLQPQGPALQVVEVVTPEQQKVVEEVVNPEQQKVVEKVVNPEEQQNVAEEVVNPEEQQKVVEKVVNPEEQQKVVAVAKAVAQQTAEVATNSSTIFHHNFNTERLNPVYQIRLHV